MKSLIKYSILTIYLLTLNKQACFAQSNETFLLNRETLFREALKKPPTIREIENSFIISKINENEILEQFDPVFESDISYGENNRSQRFSFIPIVSPTTNFSAGIKKKFTRGVTAGIYNISQRQKYGSLGVDTTNAVALQFSMDLYKDFFGRKSKAEISNAFYQKEIAKLQSQIDKRVFSINLYRTYLTIILKEEAIKISKKLLNLSKEQAKDIKKRYQNGIAQIGDLERQKLQVIDRKNEILLLKKEQQIYIRNLQELLPSIANKNIELSNYATKDLKQEIAIFINKISSKAQAPMEYTHYDEIVNYRYKAYLQQKKIDSTHSDMDLELYSEYRKSNTNDSLNDSYRNSPGNIQDNSYEVGLKLSIPFGAINENEALKNKLTKSSYLVNKHETFAKLNSYHIAIKQNLEYLKQALKNQGKNSQSFGVILKDSQKKYSQARIKLQDLIDDQNQNLLNKIFALDIEAEIVAQVCDYITVFTLAPYGISN